MITCQFCPHVVLEGAALKLGWLQVDLEMFVCPTCVPQVMTPAAASSSSGPNPEEGEIDEDAIRAEDYTRKFYRS